MPACPLHRLPAPKRPIDDYRATHARALLDIEFPHPAMVFAITFMTGYIRE